MSIADRKEAYKSSFSASELDKAKEVVQYPLTYLLNARKDNDPKASEYIAMARVTYPRRINCGFTMVKVNNAGQKKTERLSSLFETFEAEDKGNKLLYTFWEKSYGYETACRFTMTIAEKSRQRNFALLGSERVTIKKGVVDREKKRAYDNLLRSLKQQEELAKKAEENRVAEAARRAAWARIDQRIKGLQAQTAKVYADASSRLEETREYNRMAQFVRKNPGYRIVNVQRKASSPSTSSIPQIDMNHAKAIYSRTVRVKFPKKHADILAQGKHFYTIYEGDLERVRFTVENQYDLEINLRERGQFQRFLAEPKELYSGIYTHKAVWDEHQVPPKSNKKNFYPQDRPLFYDDIMFLKSKDAVGTYRSRQLEKFRSIYKNSSNKKEAQEAGLAFIIYGGRISDSSHFARVFGQGQTQENLKKRILDSLSLEYQFSQQVTELVRSLEQQLLGEKNPT